MKIKELDKLISTIVFLFLGLIFVYDGIYDFETRWIEILIGAGFISLGLFYLKKRKQTECEEIVKRVKKKSKD
jgi:hypothetical protein